MARGAAGHGEVEHLGRTRTQYSPVSACDSAAPTHDARSGDTASGPAQRQPHARGGHDGRYRGRCIDELSGMYRLLQ
jgi:hypothetical protein